MVFLGIVFKEGDEALAGKGGRIKEGHCTSEVEDGGEDVDEVAGGVAEFLFCGDALGPMCDEGGGDAALVRPGFVLSEGRVGSGGPTGAEAEVGGGGSHGGVGVVAVAAHHDFGTGAVIGEKKDEGVFEAACSFEVGDDAADFLVHAVDHGGVEGHLFCLKDLLGFAERVPGEGPVDFIFSQDFEVVGEVVGRSEVLHDGGEVNFGESEGGHFLMTLRAQFRPAGCVDFLVLRDIGGKGVEGEVGRGEGEVGEEGFFGVFFFVLAEERESSIGELGGGVEVAAFFDGRERFVVEAVGLGTEEAALVLEVVGAIKSGGDGGAIDVPFSDVVGAVAGGLEKDGGEGCPGGTLAPLGSFSAFDDVALNLLRIVAGHERGAAGPASGGVVKVGKTKAILGKGVEMWGLDFRAIAAEVGESEVIGEDDEDVGLFAGVREGKEGEEEEDAHGLGGVSEEHGQRGPGPLVRGGRLSLLGVGGQCGRAMRARECFDVGCSS